VCDKQPKFSKPIFFPLTMTSTQKHLVNGEAPSLSSDSSKNELARTIVDDAATAATAVLKPSVSMPSTATRIRGIDFNEFKAPVTVQDLTSSFARTGFQASNLARAIEVINNMVPFALYVTDDSAHGNLV
jgi:hypothetical protein